MSKKPNFFMVGAPKCGTTALSEYLREHPNIFMSTPKEPHYFATDMEGYRFVKTENDYLGLFGNVTKEHKAIGEASVYYLYSKDAIKNIFAYNKEAKIIIMLRNPVEMVYSLHSQLVESANEDVRDFMTAWELVEKRKSGDMLPENSKDHKVLFYDEIGKYNEQLENVYKYFNSEQVKIILFDDFKVNTKKIYEEILEFLNVPQDNRGKFPIINENAEPRNFWLNSLIKKQPKLLEITINKLKLILGIKQSGIGKMIISMNTKKAKRKILSDTLKQEVYKNYEPDIFKLSKLLNIDLINWKNKRST